MTSQPLRVIKLGGSLLDWPELVGRFRAWLDGQSPAANVIVVGGGVVVESVRELDRVCGLSGDVAHWLAIRGMSITAAVVADLLDEATLVRSIDRLQVETVTAPQILDVEPLLRSQHGDDDALPCSWDVTSDSIAARVANLLHADELVLLKSALPRAQRTIEAVAESGFVDAQFPAHARLLPVRMVDLRDPDFAELRLIGADRVDSAS